MKRPTLREIFERHLRQVIRAVQRSGIPQRHVEDVAQDVFVALHTALPSYDAARPLEPWLLTIAYRTARDHRLLARNRELPSGDMGDMLHLVDLGMSPERSAQYREARSAFDTLVEGLDEDQRAVYLLAEVEEYTVPEIAQALAIPVGTAASRLQRGRESFEQGLRRRRAAEQRRAGGAAALPLFLMDPRVLMDAARHLPSTSTDVAARLWGRVSSGIAAAAAGGAAGAAGAGAAAGVGAAASRLVSLTRSQILAGIVSTAIAASAMTGAVMFAILGDPARTSAPDVVADPSRAAPGDPTLAEVMADPASSSTAILTAPLAPAGGPGATPLPVQDRAATERAELALLDRARRDLSRGDAAGALTVLDRHARQYPRGVYAVERDALIVRANAARDGQDGGP